MPDIHFTAILTDPSGYYDKWSVFAKNKTEARKRIARLYREHTPPASAGFYTFSQNKLRWERISD